MWVLLLNLALGLWVFLDARKRKMERPFIWAIGAVLLMVVFVPLYFAERPLKEGEVREGGTAWNFVKAFAIFWTATMAVLGVGAMIAASGVVSNAKSAAEQAGAALGTVMGLGMIMALWFVVLAGAFVIGMFLRKNSVVERGPTGYKSSPVLAAPLEGTSNLCPHCGKYFPGEARFCPLCGKSQSLAEVHG